MTNFKCLINKSIKFLRNNSGLSQEKFCIKCGLSPDNYRNLEYNRQMPQSTTIDKICSAFNITPIELLRLGLEKSDEALIDTINHKLEGLSEKQLRIISDFISVIKNYK